MSQSFTPPITLTVNAQGQIVVTPATPPPPVLAGAFTFSPASPLTGQITTFSQSTSGGVPPYTYAWDFGDGSSSTGPGPVTHVYATAGTFTATLKTSDSTGTIATITHSITVGAPPASLACNFTFSPSSPTTAQSVTFSATASGGTPPYTYAWSFGDGSTGSGQTLAHPYTSAGTFNATLTVTDSTGATATATHSVTVTAPPPPPPTGNLTLAFQGYDWDGGGEETLTLNGKLLASLPTTNSPGNGAVWTNFTVTMPASMLFAGLNTLTFTHAPWDCGVNDNVRNLTIKDSAGNLIYANALVQTLNCTTPININFNTNPGPPPPASPTLSIAASVNPASVGQSVSFTGQLAQSGAGIPSKSITLQQSTDNGVTFTNIGTGTTDSSGNYSIAASFATAGTYQIRSMFAGG